MLIIKAPIVEATFGVDDDIPSKFSDASGEDADDDKTLNPKP